MPKPLADLYDIYMTIPDTLTAEERLHLQEALDELREVGIGPLRTAEHVALRDRIIWYQLNRENEQWAALHDEERRQQQANAEQHRQEALRRNPNLDHILRWERGRMRGKGMLLELHARYADLAQEDPALANLLAALKDYADYHANALNRNEYRTERQKLSTVLKLAVAFQKQQELNQLQDDSELGLRLLAAANEIRMYLGTQRNGELNVNDPAPGLENSLSGNVIFRDCSKMNLAPRDAGDKMVDRSSQPLFPHDPSPQDIVQGALGNCYLMSALASLAEKYPEKIRGCIIDNEDHDAAKGKKGTATVRFFRKDISPVTGECIGYTPILIRGVKITPTDGTASSCLWAQMIEAADVGAGLHVEKSVCANPVPDEQTLNAYYWQLNMLPADKQRPEVCPWLFDSNRKLHRTWKPSYASLEGGQASIFLEQLLGPEAEAESMSVNILPAGQEREDGVKAYIADAIDHGRLVMAGSLSGESDREDMNGVYRNHSYSVLAIGEKDVGGIRRTFITVRNPHGHHGREYYAEDGTLKSRVFHAPGGVFDVELSDFCREFDDIYVNRLDQVVVPVRGAAADRRRESFLSSPTMQRYLHCAEEFQRGFARERQETPEYANLRRHLALFRGSIPSRVGRRTANFVREDIFRGLELACEAYLRTARAYLDARERAKNDPSVPAPAPMDPSGYAYVKSAEKVLRMAQASLKGYSHPSYILSRELAEKVLRALAAKDAVSPDTMIQQRGAGMLELLEQKDASLQPVIDRMAETDTSLYLLCSEISLGTAFDLCRGSDSQVLELYQAVRESYAVSKVQSASPLERYQDEVLTIVSAMNDTDSVFSESSTSDAYRHLREEARSFADSFMPMHSGMDPETAAKSSRCSALMDACRDYERRCINHPLEGNKRRAARRAQMENLLLLHEAMECGCADPRELCCRKIAETLADNMARQQEVHPSAEEIAAQTDRLLQSPVFTALKEKHSFQQLAALSRKDGQNLLLLYADTVRRLPQAEQDAQEAAIRPAVPVMQNPAEPRIPENPHIPVPQISDSL